MKETVRAEDKRAIVLMEETINIFSERSKEYSPKAYKEVIPTLVINRTGTKK